MASLSPFAALRLLETFPLLKSLHGNFLFSIFIRGAAALVALAANVALARLLGVTEYGRYMILYSAAIVLGSLAVRGTDQLLTRELSAGAAGHSHWRQALGRWAGRHVVVGLVIAIALYLIWSFFMHPAGTGWNRGLADVAALILIALYAICILIAGALNGFGATLRSQTLVPLVNNGVVLALLAVLWFGMSVPVNGTAALWFQVLGYAFACALGWRWLHRLEFGRSGQHAAVAEQTLENPQPTGWGLASRHFLFITIAAVLVNRLDVVLVSMLAGNHTAGIYVAGARLAQVALLVAISANTVLSPRISLAWSYKDYSAVRKLVRRGLFFTAAVAVSEVIIAALFATDIVKLFGGAYALSASVFIWVVVAYALWSLAAPYYALFSMTGRQKSVAALSWIVAVVNVAAMFLLVPLLGATGGAIAMAMAYACVLAPLAFLTRRAYRLNTRCSTT